MKICNYIKKLFTYAAEDEITAEYYVAQRFATVGDLKIMENNTEIDEQRCSFHIADVLSESEALEIRLDFDRENQTVFAEVNHVLFKDNKGQFSQKVEFENLLELEAQPNENVGSLIKAIKTALKEFAKTERERLDNLKEYAQA